jgi:hypothetical protein
MPTTDTHFDPDIPPVPIVPKPPPIKSYTYTGQIFPKYLVLTLLYAPPGASTGGTDSTVSYSSQSTTGTTNSIEDSFQAGVTLTADVSAGLGLNAQFAVSVNANNTTQIQVTKSQTFDLALPGPDSDGINHAYDTFLVLTNPALDVTVTVTGDATVVNWTLGINGDTALIQYVRAEWLPLGQMPANVAAALPGLTQDDYDAILALDPFYPDASAAIPSPRYALTKWSYPYDPAEAGAPPPTVTYTTSSATTATTTATTQVQFQETVTLSEGLDVEGVTDKFTQAGSITVSETSTATATTGSTQQATVLLGGPSPTYPGPTNVLAYLDTVYNTFMFAFPPAGGEMVSGTIQDSDQNPVAGEQVTLEIGGLTFSTYTNSAGKYAIYSGTTSPVTGDGVLTVANQPYNVPVAANAPTVKPITI